MDCKIYLDHSGSYGLRIASKHPTCDGAVNLVDSATIANLDSSSLAL